MPKVLETNLCKINYSDSLENLVKKVIIKIFNNN